MTFREEITTLLEAAYAASPDDPPIDADRNIVFTRPADAPWIRLTFQDGGEALAAIGGQGGNLYRAPRLVFVDAFTPLDTGEGLADDLVEVARGALRYVTADAARWERFDAGPEGEAEGEYRKQLIAIFRRTVRV